MKKRNQPYHHNIFSLLFIAILSFYGFKKILPERLFSEQMVVNANIVVDSMMLQAMADTTLLSVIDNTDADTAHHTYVTVQSMDIDNSSFDPTLSVDGYQNLVRFYSKLYALEHNETKKVRVAYFGDSMNDGDLIVQDVRKIFQDNFGGKGVGFVGITSFSANARSTVKHQYSKDWVTQSSVRTNKPDRPFGVDGQVSFSNNDGDWIKYKAQGHKHSESLYEPTLFYGRADNDTAHVSIQSSGERVEISLTPAKLLNTLKVSATTQDLEVAFHHADSIPIYGFNFDNGRGVHIDNFSIRGNSGLPLSMLSAGLMNSFDRILQYDLIILQYGANVLSNEVESYDWYMRNMSVVIKNIRACFPNADILVISTADKATKFDGQMQTDPAVARLAIAQRNYAVKTNSGYINLYHLMGGEGSMIKWVDDKFAGTDYTHFNAAGSKKIGRLIYEELDRGYKKYIENKDNFIITGSEVIED